MAKALRVCYFGTYRSKYSRNQIMIEGLRRNGVEVTECHESLWTGIDDRVRVVKGGWRNPKFWFRVFKTYFRLLRSCLSCNYDVMVVGYPGHFDVYLARIITWLHHKPLVWDIFMSIYLISVERNLQKSNRLTVAILCVVEKFACKLPDLLILDTDEYVTWFGDVHNIPSSRFKLVPTGADDRIFKLQKKILPRPDQQFKVLYYGTFIPNHGVMVIIDAARLLARESQIHFELIGEGPEREHAVATAIKYALTNVSFTEWMDKDDLVKRIASADVCLGTFGETPQSLMTIQNKIYECLAMGKPLISGESVSIRNNFEHQKHVFFIKRADSQALANAIIQLKAHPEIMKRLAINGYQCFIENYTPTKLGANFTQYLNELI